jgi:hypothetical protein
MKDGVIFKTYNQFLLFGLVTFITQYNYNYVITPKKFKMHRSMHTYALFGLSVYLPYRYNHHINSIIFSITPKLGTYSSILLRLNSKFLIYGVSIFLGQCLARMYWTYKKSFNATK